MPARMQGAHVNWILVSTAVCPCNKQARVIAGQDDIWVACTGVHTHFGTTRYCLSICAPRAEDHAGLGGRGWGLPCRKLGRVPFVCPSV